MMKYIAISRAIRAAAERREPEAKSPVQRASLSATMQDRLGRSDSQSRNASNQSGATSGR